MTKGWAVKDPEGININTVSDTRRAAIVNWLVVVEKVRVTSNATDAWIEESWRNLCGPSEVMQVTVERAI